MESLIDQKNNTIIVDTDVIVNYFSSKDRNELFLRKLNENNTILLPPVVIFELLRGDNPKDLRDQYSRVIDNLPEADISSGTFFNAALLADAYTKLLGKTKIPAGDLIIGGTILGYIADRYEVLLLTCDRGDFCDPIWNLVSYYHVPRAKKQNGKNVEVMNFYLLRLNREIFKELFK